MVTQTLISFKCDRDSLGEFDSLCESLGVKRNKMLNFLVKYACLSLRDVDKLNLIRAYSSISFVDD